MQVVQGHSANKWLSRGSNLVLVDPTAELLFTNVHSIPRAYLLCDAFLESTALRAILFLWTLKHMGSATLVVHAAFGSWEKLAIVVKLGFEFRQSGFHVLFLIAELYYQLI